MTCKSTVNVCNFDADRETVRIRIWDLVTFYYELRCYNKINETESSKNSTAAEKLMLFPENWHLCWCLRKKFPFSRVFLPQVLALFCLFVYFWWQRSCLRHHMKFWVNKKDRKLIFYWLFETFFARSQLGSIFAWLLNFLLRVWDHLNFWLQMSKILSPVKL